jgi:hypothetical protein
MTPVENILYTAKASGLYIASMVAACALVLLATPSDAQTVSTAEASVSRPHEGKSRASGEDTAIRPFRVNVPQEALDDLRRRLTATPWPDQETVADP